MLAANDGANGKQITLLGLARGIERAFVSVPFRQFGQRDRIIKLESTQLG